MKYYSYFFTRQDISPEQQIVQTAHAAFQLRVNSQRWTDEDKRLENQQVSYEIYPEETHFTVVGVRNGNALRAVRLILDKFEIEYEAFIEPDFEGGEEITSIAVYPIAEDKKGPLDAFNLLTIGRK